MTTPPLRETLNDAISSGRFIDTKIVLFSRKDSLGRVCKPRALYANSHVLRSVQYFNDREFPPRPSAAHEITPFPFLVLFGTISDAETRDFSETVGDKVAEDYGYSSDSDLEEDMDFESSGPEEAHTASSFHQKDISYGRYEEIPQAGKVISIQDVAFIK